MIFVRGDATKPVSVSDSPVVIAHVCNNLGGWGKGFVLALSAMDPRPEKLYRASFTKKHPRPELGDIQLVTLNPQLSVANLIAQDGYSSRARPQALSYEALATCLSTLEARLGPSVEVHMPRIGTRLAGGKWEKIEEIITTTLTTRTVVVYDFA